MEEKLILDEKKIKKILIRISNEIIETIENLEDLIIIGMQTRGVFIAKRIIEEIEKLENIKIPLGIIDISLYRDDIYEKLKDISLKETKLPFNINDKNLILVDDVIYTGRSIRAAIDCIMDFGRPKSIKLTTFIDRGNRELPIQPDITGFYFKTRPKEEIISVKLKEIDSFDSVFLKFIH